jgi:phosphoglucomutase
VSSDESHRIDAPFSDEQVAALNHYQRQGFFHPFTCGEDDAEHVEYAEANRDRHVGLLVASRDGWHCPVCQYTQTWAHRFMTQPQPSSLTFESKTDP